VDASLGWSFTLAIFSTFCGLCVSPVLAFFNKFVPRKRPYYIIQPHKLTRLGSFGFGSSHKKREPSVYVISR
jgi:hypothetical protein